MPFEELGIRPELGRAFRTEWSFLSAPGTWFSGGERVEIAAEARELDREISERERSAEESKKRHKMLSEEEKLALIGSFEWDIPNNKVTWSDGLYEIYGLEPQEFGASFQAFLDYVHPDDREKVQAIIQQAYSEGKSFAMQETIIRADGAVRLLASRGEVIKDENGVSVRMLGICQDITERVQAEAELRQSEALKGAIFESALACIITIDHTGNIIEFNPAAEKTFGYPRDEVIGKELAETIVPPSLRESHRSGLADYLATGESSILGKRIEITGMRSDGSEFPVELAITAIDLGGPPLFTAYLQDISLRKRAEELLGDYNRALEKDVQRRTHELKKANEELEKTLQQLKKMQHQLVMQEKMATLGNLVAGIAHEVNSPIGAINSAADVSRRCIDTVTEVLETSESLEDIKKRGAVERSMELLKENNQVALTAGNRISSIIRSLKVFSRLDEARFTKLDLHDGIDSVLTLIQHQIPEGTRVVKQYGELPQIFGYADELNQVFMSLLLNACQAIEGAGEITISTCAEGNQVYVEISDTGKGIPPETLDNLFDLGFTTKSTRIGMGMGLFSAYNIVQKHEGEIRITSEVGKGTTVSTSLPI
ncbi:MAG: PAS domain S-box protein [Nitrospiraceae bacterium]